MPRRPEVVSVYRGSRAEEEDSTVACVSVGYQNGRQEGRASGGCGGMYREFIGVQNPEEKSESLLWDRMAAAAVIHRMETGS